jgi:hypothetical protein
VFHLLYIDAIAHFVALAYGVAGYFYSEMAEFDLVTNQTKYKDTLMKGFLLASESQISPGFRDK